VTGASIPIAVLAKVSQNPFGQNAHALVL